MVHAVILAALKRETGPEKPARTSFKVSKKGGFYGSRRF